jgi:energy-converting hydrogenase Eha subunit C
MLLKIDLPVVYEDSIVDAQVMIQQTSPSKKIIKSTLARQEIEMLRAESSRDIAVINVRADSEATIVFNRARLQTLKNTIY